MSLIALIFTILTLGLFFSLFFLYRHLQQKGVLMSSLNMSLFLVTMPRYQKEEAEGEKDERERIALMEQFLSSFANLKTGKFKELKRGAPYIVLEMAVHHEGANIHTYVAVPRNLESILEKQVHGFFPHAEVQKVKDYNIFNPRGASAGSYLQLKKSSILPLLTYQTLSADPVGAITTAMSKIEERTEGVALQIVLKPESTKRQKKLTEKVLQEMQSGLSLKSAVDKVFGSAKKELKKAIALPKTEEEKQNEDMLRSRGPVDETTIKTLQNKLHKQHYAVNIRLLTSADNQLRAQHILSQLEAAFVQFGSPVGNSFKPHRVKLRKFKKFVFRYSFRTPNLKNSAILSVEEIASIFHFPTTQATSLGVKYVKSKSAKPPQNLPQQGVIIGESMFRSQRTLVRIKPDDRRRHLYMIGQTGTGKSALLYNMALQDINAGEGVAVIDPHGDLVQKLLTTIPSERKEDIVWFDPGDPSRPFGLNMLEFDPARPEQKTLVVNELLAIFKKLFLAEHMGPIFDQYFRGAAMLLLDDYDHEIPTLLDIPRVLTDVEYRRDKLSREKNMQVKKFWEEQAEKAGGEASLSNMAPYITSKIDGFVADEFMKPIISQKHSSLNFREAMDNKKIILVNLSKGKIGDLNANLIGLVIVGKLLISALSRVDIPEDKRDDFFLYIDEFQNFTTDSIATILSEARKYKLNLTIAHQFIKQLQEDIRDAVFGNVGSMLAFRVGADDAEFLKNQFEPVFSENDLINIDNFNANVKLLIDGQTTDPFNIKTFPPGVI